MIAVWIMDPSRKETDYICLCTKDAVGLLSDESLSFSRIAAPEALLKLIEEDDRVDLACVDICGEGGIPAAEALRARNDNAYMVLIASMQISPVRYMRPSIRAEGLILRPMQAGMVKETMREAVSYVLKRYETPDTDTVFIVDNADGRELVPYRSIFFFESRNKKIYLNTGAREYDFYDTLDRLEEELGERFVRCHRGYLVNREKIQKVQLSKNQLLLEDGYAIPVSRTYKAVLREYGKA